jgi:glyoxylase-like metal-dependent hydrolase (beta-lactamase superfamily II)
MFPGIDNSTTMTGTLCSHLAAAGIAPVDVDTVIITHAHPDHIGGTRICPPLPAIPEPGPRDQVKAGLAMAAHLPR